MRFVHVPPRDMHRNHDLGVQESLHQRLTQPRLVCRRVGVIAGGAHASNERGPYLRVLDELQRGGDGLFGRAHARPNRLDRQLEEPVCRVGVARRQLDDDVLDLEIGKAMKGDSRGNAGQDGCMGRRPRHVLGVFAVHVRGIVTPAQLAGAARGCDDGTCVLRFHRCVFAYLAVVRDEESALLPT